MNGKLLFLFLLFPVMVLAQDFDPPEIPGWKQDGQMMTFDRSNLFNHINGAAEFYYSYGFQRLFVVRYIKGDAEMTLEVYDHSDATHAYGIYSMERPSEVEVRPIGAEGYFEENILNFVTGSFYVKMNAYREPNAGGGVLLATAHNLTGVLCAHPGLPKIIEAMPKEGLVHNSRQYISNTFMGLELLGSAYRASYNTGEGDLVLFVLERDTPQIIDGIVKAYQTLVQDKNGESTSGILRIEDPFNGPVFLNQMGHYLIGFSGADLPSLRQDLLDKIKTSLGEMESIR